MELLKQKANTLIEALPYIQKYEDKIVVIKYGGKPMHNSELKKSVLTDIILLKHVGMHPVIVHGGGPEITKAMKRARVKPQFIDGLRVTDKKTMRIVERELEKINWELVRTLKKLGGKSIGISGQDHRLIKVKQKSKELGYVGKIYKINPTIIKTLIKDDYIPVIYPIASGPKNEAYNVNADSAAASIAGALKAEKLTMMTDVDGIFEKRKLIPTLSIGELDKKIEKKVVKGGMIPKLKACRYVLRKGCKKAHLVNGTIPHALLLEIFTDEGVGTEITK